MLLQNKTAVVTGCNRGIGKKILEVFSANGATVFACVRNISEEFKSNIKEIEKNTKNKIIPIQFDLNDESQIKEAASNIVSSNSSVFTVTFKVFPFSRYIVVRSLPAKK